MIFVSHDLAVISYMCGRIGVMNNGKILEEVSAAQLNTNTVHHSYTAQLLAASRGYDHALAKELPD